MNRNRTPSEADIEQFGTVGQIMDPDWTPEPQQITEPILPPRHEGQPDFPEPGIYFGMPEDEYHAIPALSASGLKKLSASSMDFWANSWLNLDREERQNQFLDYGKAIHAFVLEGEEAYTSRYAILPEPKDFGEDAVIYTSTDEIKAAISKHTEMGPVKPVGSKKQDLIDQLAALAEKYDHPVKLEGTVPELRERIAAFSEEQPVKPVTRVTVEGPDGDEISVPAQKSDLVTQLLSLQPNALVWDDIIQKHAVSNDGKTMLRAIDDKRIRLSARMIQGHEEINAAFTGGYAEVSFFWFCPETGVPMKSRADYLKMRAVVDLKSFSNTTGMPVDRAIERAIANMRYNVQHCVYDEAVAAIRSIIRERGQLAVRSCDDCGVDTHMERVDFCEKWCAQEKPPAFIFVFQQSGIAPVTRGKVMPRANVFSITGQFITQMKRTWRECADAYGTDPWLDLSPLEEIDDDRIPLYATDLGKD